MKTFDSELKKYTEKIHMKVSERHALRERILSYMEYHPLPKQARVTRDFADAIPSEAFTFLHFNTHAFRIAGAVFVCVLAIVPFVAERSVPGDVLYLVKTNINESVQGQLISSPYKKIEFETHLMERRIAEARALADKGRLTDEVKLQIAETVKEHSDAVQESIAELRSQDADGAAIAQIAYSSSLEVQSVVLGANVNVETTSSVESILTAVNNARDVVVSEKGSTSPSFGGLMARIESETTRAYELLETVKESATAEEITDINRRLSDVNRLIEESKTKRDDGEEVIAADELVTTLRQIQKLILFMTDISIRQSVPLETIVPIVRSFDERVALLAEKKVAVETSRAEVALALPLVTDEDVAAQITEGLTAVDTILLTASTTISTTTISGAELAVRDAHTLITELLLHIRETVAPVVAGEEVTIEEPIDGETKSKASSTPATTTPAVRSTTTPNSH